MPGPGEVRIKMHYTAISAGTERALLTGDENVRGSRKEGVAPFPRFSGYSGSGLVDCLGEGVTDLRVNDRVITYWGLHQQYNTLSRANVVKIDSDAVRLLDAAFVFISTFSLAAIRKARIELGESCMVVGLGLLGLFSVQFARLAGALPIIAVDYSEERRAMATKLGADIALSPAEGDYSSNVLERTSGKGADTIIEVTGSPAALNSALLCASKFARVSLLGCTRTPTTVDFYHDVHYPGVTLIGAHTNARPSQESFPGYWTHADDCRAALNYLAKGRLNISDMIGRVYSPKEAGMVYRQLALGEDFPIGVAFDWNAL